MDVPDTRRLKAVEDENARLKKLLAEQMLDNAIPCGTAGSPLSGSSQPCALRSTLSRASSA